jgi:hypothetical protein
MNKTIYMTYKKEIPEIVTSRWKDLNKDYLIDFSLDKDCIDFLKTHFNDYIVHLFSNIRQGMYKADLWRLCKLYINGGVYADVDLVPYIDIDSLDKNISFYSSLCFDINNKAIFQAFMVNFSKPKNPLLLLFLISFLLNHPYSYQNGPTIDMYNCIKYNLKEQEIKSEKKYELNEIKIPVFFGSSSTNIKYIDLYFFPNNVNYEIKLNKNPYQDHFQFKIENNVLMISRLDKNIGWDYPHSVDICIASQESIFLFKENIGENNNWITSYVTLNEKKILDSRDLNYHYNSGW